MKFGLINGIQIEPTPKQKAECPCCGKQLIAKCGSVKVWHWSHYPERHCDQWWENETEWHRKWKGYFPIINQEVVHYDEKTGEKHIADVQTVDGRVIELQNSPITETELFSREQFYKDMLWIVNGARFKKNFTIFPFKLPPPNSAMADDLYIARLPEEIHTPDGKYYNRPIIAQKSLMEKDSGKSCRIVYTMYVGPGERQDTSEEYQKKINAVHKGHYYFQWKHQRGIWFKSTKRVFIDFGDIYVVLIEKINLDYYGACLIAKPTLVKILGGCYKE